MARKPTNKEAVKAQIESGKALIQKQEEHLKIGKVAFQHDSDGHGPGVLPEKRWQKAKAVK